MALSNNIYEFITPFINELQDIEDVLYSLKVDRFLADAEGVLLDGIGSVVGLARSSGESDTDYRARIQTKILINTYSGTIDELITASKAAINGNVFLTEPAEATISLLLDTIPSPIEKLSDVKALKPGGVALEMVYGAELGNEQMAVTANEGTSTAATTAPNGSYEAYFTGTILAGDVISITVNSTTYSQAFDTDTATTMSALVAQVVAADSSIDAGSGYAAGTLTLSPASGLLEYIVFAEMDLSGIATGTLALTGYIFVSWGEGALEKGYASNGSIVTVFNGGTFTGGTIAVTVNTVPYSQAFTTDRETTLNLLIEKIAYGGDDVSLSSSYNDTTYTLILEEGTIGVLSTGGVVWNLAGIVGTMAVSTHTQTSGVYDAGHAAERYLEF